MSEKKKIIVALIVFIASFVIFKALFSNWDTIKDLFL